MTDRNGVEIDYCPECRGIWLDRGELDQIIERSSRAVSSSKSNDNFRQSQNYSDQKSYGTKKKKNESFLSVLFDF
jgi:Zn-finger nucleic acid-binding protein